VLCNALNHIHFRSGSQDEGSDGRDRLHLNQDRVELASDDFLRHFTGMMEPQTSQSPAAHRFCIAPMMEWTDRW